MDKKYINNTIKDSAFSAKITMSKKELIRIGLYATVPFQTRVLEPIAKSFKSSFISFDPEELKQWNPQVIIVTAEHEIPLFRDYCTQNNVTLIALRHGAGFKYVSPPEEYRFADYICGSDWDQKDFERAGIRPIKGFLITGNPWVDHVFKLPNHKLNKQNPTFLFAPTWNPDTSAANFFEGRITNLIRKSFPESRIIIRPHPNILTYNHPYLIKYSDLYKRWINSWESETLNNEGVEFVTDTKLSLPSLFTYSDVMISDASTAIFEFMILNRPILLYTHDQKPNIENYDPQALGNSMRDIGSQFFNDKEFDHCLKNVFDDYECTYSYNQKKHKDEIFGKYQDGNSALRVVEAIKKLEEGNLVEDLHDEKLTITKESGDGSKLISIDYESDFAKAISDIFFEYKPTKILETGTYLGQGTTRIIAETIRKMELNAEFHTIEVNPLFYSHAFDNLLKEGLLKYVYLHNGLSVPKKILPSNDQIRQITIEEIHGKSIFVDHYETERVFLYQKETEFKNVQEDLIGKCLRLFDFKPDFVLLDSGGHLGNIEFNYLIENLQAECIIALDDVHHVKHHKSLQQMQKDKRFIILKHSDEKFGFCVAKYTPELCVNKLVPKSNIKKNQNESLPEHIVAIGLVEHLGDIIAAEPIGRYVRKLYPESYIVWVVNNKYSEIIETNPYIDEVYSIGCLTEWEILKSSFVFDEVIDLHIPERVCPVCNIPLKKTNGRLDITLDNYYYFGNLLSVFSQSAGIPIIDEKPEIYIDNQSRNWVDQLNLPHNFIAIHCLSNEYTRDWQDNKWIELAKEIENIYQIPIVEVGTRSVLANDSSIKYTNLCGQTTVLQTAEIIRKASLFIGIDSSCAHLCNAVGTYGIVLLGKYRAFNKYIPYSGEFGKGINSDIIYAAEGSASEIPVSQVLFAIGKALKLNSENKPKELPQAVDIRNTKDCIKRFLGKSEVRMLAMYLPQFHPIPENDRWWGKGFTEWTNVTKAKPLFPGHYQPHLPADLGFYDLRLAESRKAQAELAQKYGIEGFCYYHYWFNGKRLLERPFNEVLESGEPDFPFCLAWANENWSRRWDGRETELLQEQIYGGIEDAIQHFQWLLKAFNDIRYIRINNQPVFLIYRPSAVPNIIEVISTWKELALHAGLGGIYLIAMKTGFEPLPKNYWIEKGFDAELIFQPGYGEINKLNIYTSLSKLGADEHVSTKAIILDYRKASEKMAEEVTEEDNCYSCVVPSWDSTSRRAKIGAYILHDSTPEAYQKWLDKEVQRVLNRKDENRLLFINAWNEWAEGNHLEPDQKFGHGYLKATLNSSIKALLNLSFVALQREDYKESESLSKKALFLFARNNAENIHLESEISKPVLGNSRRILNDEICSLLLLLSIIRIKEARFAEAAEILKNIINSGTENVASFVIIADLLFKNNQIEDSKKVYERLFSNDNIETQTIQIAMFALISKNDLASKYFSQILIENRKETLDSVPSSTFELQILRTGVLEDFGVSMELAVKTYKIQHIHNLGKKYFDAGHHEMAKKCFEEVLDFMPYHYPSLIELGNSYNKLGDLKRALECIYKALEIKPNDTKILKVLADIYIDNNILDEAVPIYKELIKSNPHNVDVLLSVARLQLKINESKEAERILQNVVDIEPQNYKAIYMLEAIRKNNIQNNSEWQL